MMTMLKEDNLKAMKKNVVLIKSVTFFYSKCNKDYHHHHLSHI